MGNHARDVCPDCGATKLRRAKRCRSCANKAQVGKPRTDTPSRSAGWHRARTLRPLTQCEYEGCESMGMDRHHIDGDPLNNTVENIAVYCRRHHMLVDGRLEVVAARAAEVGKRYGGYTRERRNA